MTLIRTGRPNTYLKFSSPKYTQCHMVDINIAEKRMEKF